MKIWVSLTTSPTRINQLEKTLDSLLNQSHAPEKIVLNIPHVFQRTGDFYSIPDWLNEKIVKWGSGKIHINRCDDKGSITKLLPTLSLIDKDEDVWIATADDDIDYLPHTLETYTRFTECWTVKMAMALSGFVFGTLYGSLCCVGAKKTEAVEVVEGYSLPIYHRSFFQDSFDGYVAKCLLHDDLKKSDDVIISNWLALNKIQRLQVGVPWCSRNRLWGENRILDYGNQGDALHVMDDNPQKYAKALLYLDSIGMNAFHKVSQNPPDK